MSGFPLKPGCRSVCRPVRSEVRHFKASALCRVAKSAKDGGASAGEIHDALRDCGLLCTTEVRQARQRVSDWLSEQQKLPLKQIWFLLVEIAEIAVPDSWLKWFTGKYKLIKLLLQLNKLFQLASDIEDVAGFYDRTTDVMGYVDGVLEGMCENVGESGEW